MIDTLLLCGAASAAALIFIIALAAVIGFALSFLTSTANALDILLEQVYTLYYLLTGRKRENQRLERTDYTLKQGKET